MPRTAEGRAKLAAGRWGRYSSKDVLRYVRNPSRESAGWAREGILTRGVLEAGDLPDLIKLAELGGRFHSVSWGNTGRMEEWDADTTRQWLEVMFEHGWDGKGGKPLVLLSVAEHHPELVDMWRKRAPQAWHTRRNWLDGQIVMGRNMDVERIVAWMGVGATHANSERLELDSWMQHSSEDLIVEALQGIHKFMREDKTRRRVRGEPAFRDWPWAQTMQMAVNHAKIEVSKCLVDLHGPLSMEQVIDLVCRSDQPQHAMTQVRQWDWKLPHADDRRGVDFLGQAILLQARAQARPADREAFALHLIEMGYGGDLPKDATEYVAKFGSEPLKRAIDAGILQKSTPTPTVFAPTTRRRI